MKRAFYMLLVALCLPLCACTAEKQQTSGISLPGNASTGYVWQVAECSPNVSVKEGIYTEENIGDGHVGGGGTFYFELEGLSPGNALVTFAYIRPWEGEDVPPVETRTYTVTVAPDLSVSYME